MGLAAQPQQEHFAIYTLIYVRKISKNAQLLDWHKTVIYIMILTFFLENYSFNHKLAPPLWRHTLYWKTILNIWQNIKATGQKSQINNLKLFSELGKI